MADSDKKKKDAEEKPMDEATDADAQEAEVVQPEAADPPPDQPAESEKTADAAVEDTAEPEVVADDKADAELKAEESSQDEAEAKEASEKPDKAETKKAETKKVGKKKEDRKEEPPGAHLEPILVEAKAGKGETEEDLAARYAQTDEPASSGASAESGSEQAEEAVATVKIDAKSTYIATGKRKSSIARVILKAGKGEVTVNRSKLDEYFPRLVLQHAVLAPLKIAGVEKKMDVVARVHGGGIAGQAQAVRHGIAKALAGADHNVRGPLKRKGFLTRDARVKERRKAGLKKARKRPQFSKR